MVPGQHRGPGSGTQPQAPGGVHAEHVDVVADEPRALVEVPFDPEAAAFEPEDRRAQGFPVGHRETAVRQHRKLVKLIVPEPVRERESCPRASVEHRQPVFARHEYPSGRVLDDSEQVLIGGAAGKFHVLEPPPAA